MLINHVFFKTSVEFSGKSSIFLWSKKILKPFSRIFVLAITTPGNVFRNHNSGIMSLKLYSKSLPCVNLKVVFRIKNRLNSKFTLKDKISKEIISLLWYKIQCSSYNATYYGKAKRRFKVLWESLHVQVKTLSLLKTMLCDHMLVCNSIGSFEDFSVLANGTNDFII